jgi:multiple sugar transport system permease protein
LGLVLVVTVAPLWVVLKAALEPAALLFQNATQWWPTQPTLDNFRRVLGLVSTEESLSLGGSGAEVHFGRALLNSLVFTTVVVVTQTLSSAMAAYALARLEFRGRHLVFGLFVASMMVPGVVTFIPNFVLMRELGLLNTMWAMVAPFCLMQGASIFLLRQFFLSMPRDMEEAARIDGAGPFTIFWRIVLPISTTPVAASAVLTAIGMWNEFFWPHLVAKDEALQVLPVALQAFKSQTPQGQPDWTGLMAAASLAVLPTLALLAVLGRRVVESVQFSGGK